MSRDTWVNRLLAGCIFEGSAVRTADELNASVILLALDQGWQGDVANGDPADRDALFGLAQDTNGWADDADDSDRLAEASANAVEWMNGEPSIVPAGYALSFDDGLYCSKVTCGNCECHNEECAACVREFNEATGAVGDDHPGESLADVEAWDARDEWISDNSTSEEH